MKHRQNLMALLLVAVSSLSARPATSGSVDKAIAEADAIGGQRATDWPVVRHDAANTARLDSAIRPPFHLDWRVPCCKNPSNTLLASGGVVCLSNAVTFGGEQLNLSLYNQRGSLVWRIPDVLPVYLKGDRLVVVTQKFRSAASSFVCYDWKRRRKVWESPVEGEVYKFQGCIERHGRLLCSYSYALPDRSARTCLSAINIKTGALDATFQPVEQSWTVGPPASDREHVYFGMGHRLFVLDAQSLTQEYECDDGGNANYLIAGSVLITKGWDHTMTAFDTQTMQQIWTHGASREVLHCIAKGPAGKTVLIESSSATFVSTGARAWLAPIYSVDSFSTGSLVIAASAQGPYGVISGFVALDSKTGKVVWRYSRPGLGGQAVIMSDGCLYGTGNDGYLYKFSGR